MHATAHAKSDYDSVEPVLCFPRSMGSTLNSDHQASALCAFTRWSISGIIAHHFPNESFLVHPYTAKATHLRHLCQGIGDSWFAIPFRVVLPSPPEEAPPAAVTLFPLRLSPGGYSSAFSHGGFSGSWHFIQTEPGNMWPFVPGFFHLVSCFQGSTALEHVPLIQPLFGWQPIDWINQICLLGWWTFRLYRLLGSHEWSWRWAVLCVFLCSSIGCVCRSGIFKSRGNSVSNTL